MNIQSKLIFDTALIDKAIAGIRSLKIAELKARREISWKLDKYSKSYVVATARPVGSALGIAIDLDVMDTDGYSDTKNIGMARVGGTMATANSEQSAFEKVQATAIQRLQILKTRGII